MEDIGIKWKFFVLPPPKKRERFLAFFTAGGGEGQVKNLLSVLYPTAEATF